MATGKAADVGRMTLKGDVVTATFLLLNVSMGVGMLSMPGMLKDAGFGLGVILRLQTYLILGFTWNLIIRAGHLAHSFTYQGVMTVSFGRVGFVLATIFMLVFPFLLATEQLIVVGDTAVALLKIVVADDNEEKFYTKKEFLIAVILAGIMLPLSLFRDITYLAKWSLLSVIAVVMIVVIVAVRFVTLNLPATPDAYQFAGDEITRALGTLNHTMTSHYSALIIYNSIENKSKAKWSYVVFISTLTLGVLYLVMAILGYATFTENTLPDVAENYCVGDVVFNVGRLVLIIMIALTYPPELFAMREALELSIFGKYQPSPLYRHVLMTLIILAGTYGIAISVTCLAFITALNGSLAGTPLAIIMPALAVLKLQRLPVFTYDNRFLLMVVVYGFVVSLGGTTLTIINAIVDPGGCDSPEEPAFCLTDNNTGLFNATTFSP